LGVKTAALVTGVGFPRRRSAIPSPDFIEIAAPRVISTGIRVWDDQRAVCDRSRASIGHRNALGGDFDCGAELHGGAFAGARAFRPFGAQIWEQRTPGACAGLKQTRTRHVRGDVALQGFSHGGAASGIVGVRCTGRCRGLRPF